MPRITDQERAEWQRELEDQWHAENQADPLETLPHSMRMCLRAARDYSMRELANAFVYRTHDIEPDPYGWCTDRQYRYTSHQWVRPEDLCYSTFDGWY